MTKTRTALIVGVGASGGLGAAAARRFASEGLHVVIAVRTLATLNQVVAEIQVLGGSAQAT